MLDTFDDFQFTDINECSEGTSGCEQNCDNSDGAFVCSCVSGFQLQVDNRSCIQTGILGLDKNDSYNIFRLSFLEYILLSIIIYVEWCKIWGNLFQNRTSVSELDLSVNMPATILPVSTSAYVRLDLNSQPTMKIAKVGISKSGVINNHHIRYFKFLYTEYIFSDINECERRICSQQCTDTEGSYACSCFPGYQLNADRTTCSRNFCFVH